MSPLSKDETGHGGLSHPHPQNFRSKTSKFLNKDVEHASAIIGYPMAKNLPEPNGNST
jgi:hypothetical protein